MDYSTVSTIAKTYGLIFLIVMFAVAVGYALWPRNRRKFRDAAKIPFKED